MAGKSVFGNIIKMLAVLVALFILIQPASAIVINKVIVKPGNGSVIVGVNYTLDPVSAIRVFIFGAKAIEKDITSLFSSNSSSFETLRIGYNYAEFVFPANYTGCTTYFKGINLTKSVDVVIYAGTPVDIGKTNKISPIYFCTSVEKQ